MKDLTVEEVREFLSIDAETGIMIWLPRDRKHFSSNASHGRWNVRYANKEAFTYVYKGYRVGQIKNKRYLAHRIVWLYFYGEFPNIIDHIDRNPLNNSLANLRSVTQKENSRNCKLSVQNKSGFSGISYDKKRKRWVCKIGSKHLGNFVFKEDALARRRLAEEEYGYLEGHNNVY